MTLVKQEHGICYWQKENHLYIANARCMLFAPTEETYNRFVTLLQEKRLEAKKTTKGGIIAYHQPSCSITTILGTDDRDTTTPTLNFTILGLEKTVWKLAPELLHDLSLLPTLNDQKTKEEGQRFAQDIWKIYETTRKKIKPTLPVKKIFATMIKGIYDSYD